MAQGSLPRVAAIMARNEATRYLRDTIESLKPLCDTILLLDDHSEDQTAQLAWDLGCEVKERPAGEPMWGRETGARQELWNWGSEVAGDGWLYIADADHITHADPEMWRTLCTAWNTSAWAMPLMDVWDQPSQHRIDGFWQGYQIPRPWVVGVAPSTIWIEHRGWMRASDRKDKYERYKSTFDQMSPFERAHVESLLEAPC